MSAWRERSIGGDPGNTLADDWRPIPPITPEQQAAALRLLADQPDRQTLADMLGLTQGVRS